MAKLRTAHASTHGARKPPGPIFNDVISYVENSNLNYFINKTPFSATISIKSSLIKRHETAAEPGIKFKDSDYKDNLMKEIAMLKEKLKFAEKAADEIRT